MKKNQNIEIVCYNASYKKQWDAFIDEAKNSTFLFKRDFMEYHKNRFEDFSLLFFVDDELKAALPANKVKDTLYSHQGLTYGGLVVAKNVDKDFFFEILNELQIFLKQNCFQSFILKQKQFVYNQEVFTWEQLYFQDVLKSDLNLIANLSNLTISKSKLKHYRKNSKKGFIVKQEESLSNFWMNVLEPLLWEKYQAKPVHNLDEIQQLKDLFPNNIQQFSLYYEEEIVAGITVFIKDNVVKSQYGAATSLGKELRAMDYLFIQLLYHFKESKYLYFDMGTVADDHFEDGINKGLLQQKIELGCEITNQVTFKLNIE